MKPSPSELWGLLKQAGGAWVEDRAPSMGAALAYYTAFSLAPLLLIIIALAGLVFGGDAARGAVVGEVTSLVGENGGQAVSAMLEGASNREDGIVATVVSILTLVLGATTVFVELQDDLDRVWKAPPRTGSGIWNFVRSRLLSFGMILGVGFLLIVSLVISTAVAAFGKIWGGWFEGFEAVMHGLNFLISFAVITALFAMIYKILPNIEIAWRDVWIGAAATSLLFAIGKFLIGLYIGKSAVSSSFGAAGAFVVLLIWIYYSTQIFLFGAEFAYAYAHRYGSLRGKEERSGAPPNVAEAKGRTAAPARPAATPASHPAPAPEPRPAFAVQAAPVPPPAAARESTAPQQGSYLERHPLLEFGLLTSAGAALAALVRWAFVQKIPRLRVRRTAWR